jgi:hypothetical protein
MHSAPLVAMGFRPATIIAMCEEVAEQHVLFSRQARILLVELPGPDGNKKRVTPHRSGPSSKIPMDSSSCERFYCAATSFEESGGVTSGRERDSGNGIHVDCR